MRILLVTVWFLAGIGLVGRYVMDCEWEDLLGGYAVLLLVLGTVLGVVWAAGGLG